MTRASDGALTEMLHCHTLSIAQEHRAIRVAVGPAAVTIVALRIKVVRRAEGAVGAGKRIGIGVQTSTPGSGEGPGDGCGRLAEDDGRCAV